VRRKGRDVVPSHGAILLREVAQHRAIVLISCNFCPRRGKASVERLMQDQHSNSHLLRILSPGLP
jgi:hypothetical protein